MFLVTLGPLLAHPIINTMIYHQPESTQIATLLTYVSLYCGNSGCYQLCSSCQNSCNKLAVVMKIKLKEFVRFLLQYLFLHFVLIMLCLICRASIIGGIFYYRLYCSYLVLSLYLIILSLRMQEKNINCQTYALFTQKTCSIKIFFTF